MYFKYRVEWYNTVSESEVKDQGLVFATDFGDAANSICGDYGKDEVIRIELEPLGDCCKTISWTEVKATFEEIHIDE